jgi:hypothetical protein
MKPMNVDEMLNLDPMLPIIDNGGSNGEEDVEFRRLLRTERFYVDLLNPSTLPERHRSLFVIERLFGDNYDNLYISWMAELADRSVHSPFHFIGIHETTHDARREPDDCIMADTYRVPQSTIDRFREKATEQLSVKQRRALLPHPKRAKRMLAFDGTPTDLLA